MTASEDERADVRGADAPESRESPAEAADPVEVTDTEPAADTTDEKPPARPKKKGSFWKELPILIGIALVLTFLIQTFAARVYVIPSGSMEQTLHGCTGCTGDRILVDRITYDFTDPSPGDVIVFKGPPGWDQSEFNVNESSNVVVRWLREFGSSIGIGSPPEYDLVKRVIATGGQTVSCCDDHNRVIVDGKPINEPYIYWEPGTAPVQHPFPSVTIPKGDLWVMGDNRNDSFDSRYQNGGGIHGVVPVGNVIGIARVIIWPPGRWRGVGEIDSQTLPFSLSAPTWPDAPAGILPLGVGALGAFPTLWLGRRFRARLRSRTRR
ncbi:MAG TPA: signal peptidase I [Pseudonocardiaceae bacterium]|jgi:signal peptidase I|nr:signal peptidase I [Pseudonocardiaceae bacterium]